MRAIDCFTSPSGLAKASRANAGRMPTSGSIHLLGVVVLEREHAEIGVADEDDLLRAEKALQDAQRPDGVVSGDPAGVAYDVASPSSSPKILWTSRRASIACQHCDGGSNSGAATLATSATDVQP